VTLAHSLVLEDFVVDSRTCLMHDLISINLSTHYGWIEYKELRAGLNDAGSVLSFLSVDVIVLVADFCRELHLMRKKNHLLITWWVKEMVW
jgi:hypothetical protein